MIQRVFVTISGVVTDIVSVPAIEIIDFEDFKFYQPSKNRRFFGLQN